MDMAANPPASAERKLEINEFCKHRKNTKKTQTSSKQKVLYGFCHPLIFLKKFSFYRSDQT
jgi:hypothetical protein